MLRDSRQGLNRMPCLDIKIILLVGLLISQQMFVVRLEAHSVIGLRKTRRLVNSRLAYNRRFYIVAYSGHQIIKIQLINLKIILIENYFAVGFFFMVRAPQWRSLLLLTYRLTVNNFTVSIYRLHLTVNIIVILQVFQHNVL